MYNAIIMASLFLGPSANASSIKECTPKQGPYFEGSIEQTQSLPGTFFYIKAHGFHANTHLICSSSDTCVGLDNAGTYLVTGEIKRNPNGDVVGYVIHRDQNNQSSSMFGDPLIAIQ